MQLGLCAAALVSARVAVASDLDPHTGALRSTAPSAIMIGFENPTQIATLGVALTKIQRGGSGFGSTLVFVDGSGSAMTADDLAAHEAPDPAVEGSHALLLGTGPADGASGILVPWSKLSPLVSTQKIQVTVWVRSNGATPLLVATYGRGTLPVAGTFTSVTAIPTGRETSDRWAELSTGPIDTAIWGVPLAQITVGLSSSDSRRSSSATLVVDALEIVPIAGTPLPPNPCTMATQDAACGPDGECQFGHCLPAYASWGPTPPAEHRADFVERWISLAKQVHGARNATANAGAMVAARPSLTAAQVGGRQFYAGMIGLVNGLRNHHTNFGSPANGGLLQPIMAGVSSSTLGACAGFGELDLLEDPEHRTQMLGFLIYEVAPTSVVGATLKVGDAITAIDGIDPLTWVRSVYLTYATGVPSDPGADLAWAAASVAWMISHRASTLEVTRCASATECTGSNRSVLQIDVAGPAWRNLQGTGLLGNEQDPNLLGCTERFRNALTNLPTSTSGSDTVTTQTIWGDVLGVQFDGTLADFAAWEGSFLAAFSANPSPTKILFDVRQGNGGYAGQRRAHRGGNSRPEPADRRGRVPGGGLGRERHRAEPSRGASGSLPVLRDGDDHPLRSPLRLHRGLLLPRRLLRAGRLRAVARQPECSDPALCAGLARGPRRVAAGRRRLG
jgi:hypothetical protein